MTTPHWIELDGLANARDVGGLPLAGGGQVRSGRLLRSDNLQDLTPGDIAELVHTRGVTTVLDLRTAAEVAGEGPGPLTEVGGVEIHNLSLFPEAATPDIEGSIYALLPWQRRQPGQVDAVADIYGKYLANRPDSVLQALRLIAASSGATLVHCAAGKDRTGVIVALALLEVGVPRDEVLADYLATGDRIHRILERLAGSKTYGAAEHILDVARNTPQAETMDALLDDIEARFGGVGGWLRANGWTETDAESLRAALVDGAAG